MIETVQRVASPPHRGLAREGVTLRIGDAEQVVEVVRQPRHLGGWQAYWRCPRCEALRSDLFVVERVLACRVCHGLDYRSRHVLHPALTRAAKLRRKLGAAPGLLSPLPRKPRHWSPVHYRRLVAELIATERVLAAMLSATVKALERRKGRLHGPR
jgi:hypothetical protein